MQITYSQIISSVSSKSLVNDACGNIKSQSGRDKSFTLRYKRLKNNRVQISKPHVANQTNSQSKQESIESSRAASTHESGCEADMLESAEVGHSPSRPQQEPINLKHEKSK
ncbi:unnamed protein product [Leptidea sinapis]|uniref:Uncharacterized protein n=1 Tax=Leptidea sinapis TaxID=189913 RepID=A0A5E4R7R9_9NEOP|nr:unnamed protein product [Leptidea sinapis]